MAVLPGQEKPLRFQGFRGGSEVYGQKLAFPGQLGPAPLCVLLGCSGLEHQLLNFAIQPHSPLLDSFVPRVGQQRLPVMVQYLSDLLLPDEGFHQ